MFCIRLVIYINYITRHFISYIRSVISIVRRAVNHFLLVFCVSMRHALIQTTNVATSTTIDTNHERSTSTRMETIARGEGLYKAFHEDRESASSDLMSCACRAHHGVH